MAFMAEDKHIIKYLRQRKRYRYGFVSFAKDLGNTPGEGDLVTDIDCLKECLFYEWNKFYKRIFYNDVAE